MTVGARAGGGCAITRMLPYVPFEPVYGSHCDSRSKGVGQWITSGKSMHF